ncbi:GerW family sporulation protein [Nocardiopsis nanhaiensis]
MPRNKARGGTMAALTSLLDNARSVASSTTAFGDPVTSGSTTVVPVARVSILSTMGGGTGNVPFYGGDGAGGIGYTRVRPSGFLVVNPDGASFRLIRQPASMLVVPLAAITAVAVTRIVSVSVKEARRRKRIAVEQAQQQKERSAG